MTETHIRSHEGKGVDGYLVLWKKFHADRTAPNGQFSDGNL